MPKTYDAVIRVSRRNGRGENGEEWSPDKQRNAIAAYAQSHDMTIAETVDESDSVSGGTVERDGLRYAVDRAMNGKTDGIIVAKLDRFSRSITGGLAVINKLEAAGLNLVSVVEGPIVGDEAPTATGKLIRSFFLMLAEWQRDTLSESWEATRRSHIGRGIGTQEPYGYRKGPDRRLVVVEHEARVVRHMFAQRGDGVGWVQIAADLNERAETDPEWAPRTQNGDRRTATGWAHNRVKSIVENRVYLGEVASGKDLRAVDAHPAIIEPADFARAENLREAGIRRERGGFMLTGLVRCASCGSTMVGNTTHKGDTSYRRYRCRRNLPGGKHCEAPASIPADEIEDYAYAELVDWVGRLSLTPTDDGSVTDAARVLEDARASLDAFYAAKSTRDLVRTAPAAYEAAVAGYLADVQAAEEAFNEARDAAIGVTLPTDLETVWPDLSTDDKRRAFAEVFDAFAVARAKSNRWARPEVASRVRVFGRGTLPADVGPIVVGEHPTGAGVTSL